MFGLGPTELLVILVLALLVLGPTRMPDAAASLGKAIRSFRKAARDLQGQFEVEDHIRQPLEELRSALRDEPPPSRFHDAMQKAAQQPAPAAGLMAPALPSPPALTPTLSREEREREPEAVVGSAPVPDVPSPAGGRGQGEGGQ